MRAAILRGLDERLEITELSDPIANADEAVVELQAAALNKRDYWITKGKYPGITFPLVIGSDGAGIVDGNEVVFDPGLQWGNHPSYFDSAFRIIGMPEFGTLAEKVVVPASNLYARPAHLNWAEAAALPVCGVTAYRALLNRGRAKAGERLLITGIGGGVASMGLLFGVALGLEVWVSSSSEYKIDLATQHGARGGVAYNRTGWEKELVEKAGGRFDLVIDGAGGPDFANLMTIMNPAGRIVIYGGTRGLIEGLSPQRIFWKQLDILGSTMGSPEDFSHMIDFVNQHKIKPVVSHIFPLQDINDAMAVIAKGEQFGKICIDITGG